MNRNAFPVTALAFLLVGAAACSGGADQPARHRVTDAACPTVQHVRHAAIVDYADFVHWNDRDFVRGRLHVTEADLGQAVGTVTCSISGLALGPHDVLGRVHNGNAASLQAGTTLFASRTRPHCVLITKSGAHDLTAWTDVRCA